MRGYGALTENIEYKKHGGDKWIADKKNVIIRLNLSNLIQNYPATLATLVKITREEDNELLTEFAHNVINKNKDKLYNLKFPENIDLRAAQLEEAVLLGAQLQNADLSEAYLQEAKLDNALLCYADLKDANFLTAEQLSKAFSLYNVNNLNPDLEKEIKEKYPHLLEPNYEIRECNDKDKGIHFAEKKTN